MESLVLSKYNTESMASKKKMADNKIRPIKSVMSRMNAC